MRTLILVGFVFALAGCASTPLTAQEFAVRVLRKSDAPTTCQNLGMVTAMGKGGFATEDGLAADLKKLTSARGGDTVTWDKQDTPAEGGSVYGTAFKCN